MVSLTINHGVMSRVGAQINEIFRELHETHRRDTISVKTMALKRIVRLRK